MAHPYRFLRDILYHIFGRASANSFKIYIAERKFKAWFCRVCTRNSSGADGVIKTMAASGRAPEQLDENKWPEYKKPHGTIEFCVSKADAAHIKTLARRHGTALQKRVKDKSLHHLGGGVSAAKMIEEQTENDIMNRLYSKHKTPAGN